MDQRDRVDLGDGNERVLIAYANDRAGAVIRAADSLSGYLMRDALAVELAEIGSAPPPQDYDAVVIALGRHTRSVIDYVREHRAALDQMPSFLFSIDPAGPDLGGADRRLARMIERTGWHPVDWTTLRPVSPSELHRIGSSPRDVEQREDIHDFALRVADEIPAAAVQPSYL